MKNDNNKYDVIEIQSLNVTFTFYFYSICIGFCVLLKWLRSFLWTFAKKTIQCKNIGDCENFFDGNYDKPPLILVDNKLGQHSYVKLKNVKFHYVEVGSHDSPLLLLLHGFPDCWLGWRNQIVEMSHFFRVIAIDLKGFNDTDKPIWRHAYTPMQICQELKQFVSSLGYKTVTVIGHDIGGVIGWFFAHSYQDYIERFVCVSASHPNLIWNNISAKSIINKSWLQFVQLPILPEIEFSSSRSKFLESCFKNILNSIGTNGLKSVVTLRRSRRDLLQNDYFKLNMIDTYKYVFNRKEDWTGPLNYYRNFPFYRIKEGSTVRCPVLIITGSADEWDGLESIVKSAEYCNNFVVKIIQGATHWPHQEDPREFNKIVLNYLVGYRAIQDQTTFSPEKHSRSLVGRMFGAVTNSVKMGSTMFETVTKNK